MHGESHQVPTSKYQVPSFKSEALKRAQKVAGDTARQRLDSGGFSIAFAHERFLWICRRLVRAKAAVNAPHSKRFANLQALGVWNLELSPPLISIAESGICLNLPPCSRPLICLT